MLDDFLRFVVAWKLCSTMRASDVTTTFDLALAASELDEVTVVHRPRLLSDNGSSTIAGDLAEWLGGPGHDPHPGRPRHPQTQGKIERWHQTLKNVRRRNDPPDRFPLLLTLLERHYLPSHLKVQVGAFIERYNHARPHESRRDLTPADVHFGPGEAILVERARIKRRTLTTRRLRHHARAA